jgi:endonuclease/exonuclease/phosphatase family metal-dependent hydrolase
MLKPIAALILSSLAALGATGTNVGGADRPPPSAAVPADGRLTVMTYNIKGLPWPVASGRAEAIAAIGARLAALRRQGRQPHVLLLQEAFTSDATTIAARAGYAHAAYGPEPAQRSAIAGDAGDLRHVAQARWDRGEGMGKQLGSGLIILSDYPIIEIDRMAYPDFACAGFDCLANKGVLIAHLRVPGFDRPVSVVNTHLNARKAAGVAVGRSNHAFARQVELMATFIRAQVDGGRVLLVGGDMNIGGDPLRSAAFFGGFARAGLGFVRPHLGGARVAVDQGWCPPTDRQDLARSNQKAKDWLFARGADGRPMSVAGSSVPFGTQDGPALSDHIGYAIDYRPRAARLATRAADGATL